MILDSFRLAGKNVLVTGSRKGLGASIALALAEAGAKVACHGKSEDANQICEAVRAHGVKSLLGLKLPVRMLSKQGRTDELSDLSKIDAGAQDREGLFTSEFSLWPGSYSRVLEICSGAGRAQDEEMCEKAQFWPPQEDLHNIHRAEDFNENIFRQSLDD